MRTDINLAAEPGAIFAAADKAQPAMRDISRTIYARATCCHALALEDDARAPKEDGFLEEEADRRRPPRLDFIYRRMTLKISSYQRRPATVIAPANAAIGLLSYCSI